MNVPIRENPNARIASSTVQLFSASRFSTTMAECSKAAEINQGMKLAFFDRIPEPEPAPAEFIIGPPRPQRDTHSQKQPGGKGPGAYPAPPRRINAPLDQGGDGEREAHRKADIAEVEERRVEGEADILQQRVQVLSIKWRNFKALKRVRRPKNEGKEGHADCPLNAEHPRAQAIRQSTSEPRCRGSEKRKDQHPEQE